MILGLSIVLINLILITRLLLLHSTEVCWGKHMRKVLKRLKRKLPLIILSLWLASLTAGQAIGMDTWVC